MQMYHLMLKHLGPQHWWPGDTALEIMVGAILTQNTNWNNVEKAMENLKREHLLSIEILYDISIEKLAEGIRLAGYYNLKAGRLKNLITFLMDKYDGNSDLLFREDTYEMREHLLSIKGIGPETADSIILYAAGQPIFVIDAYTYRILRRHDLVDDSMTYDELQGFFMDNLPQDMDLFNEFHALIVKTGKEYCGRKPRCEICPLNTWEREAD